MAQTGFTPIQLYNSSTASAAPTSGNLVAGELAINTADGKLFYLDNLNAVQVIAWKSIPVTVINATGTPSSTTFLRGDGSWATPSTVAGSVVVGTTAITSGTSGRILYDNAGTLGELATTGTGSVVLNTRPTMSVTGAGLTLQDATDTTKQANFDLSTLTTGTTYSYKLPVLSGSTLAVLGLAQTWSALQTFSGALTVSSGNLTVSGVGAGINATTQTTGTSTIGGTAQTGDITFGQSTLAQNINISNGAASTSIVNIGGTGLSTGAINIGRSTGTFTLNIGSGVTASTQTRTVNIGTTTVGTGITNVTIGKFSSTVGHTTNINGNTVNFSANSLNLASVANLTLPANTKQTVSLYSDLASLTGVAQGSRAFISDNLITPVFNAIAQDGSGTGFSTPVFYDGTNWRCG